MNQATRQEWEAKLRALESLLNHEGWQLFVAVQQQTAELALREAIAAKDPIDMAKRLGAHNAVSQLIAWPQLQVTAIRAGIQHPE